MMTSFSLDPWRQSKTYITPKIKRKLLLRRAKHTACYLKNITLTVLMAYPEYS